MFNVLLSLVLSLALALVAYFKKAMTPKALFFAFIFAFIIIYCGGLVSFLILVTVFLGSIIEKLVFKKKKDEITKKSGPKDSIQILANVSLGTIFTLFYKTTHNTIFLILYASIMAESLADTLASDIGIHSKKNTINILTLQKSTPGLSGNITFLGLASAFIGSFLISLIYYAFSSSFIGILIITLSGFLGSICDSFLGATVQVKYKCSKCNIITEKNFHCENKTNYYQGLKFINNDTVNFLSNLIALLLSFILIKIFAI